MRFIRRILDRRTVWDTLPDYPVYSPPFGYGKGWKTIPPRNQIEQNYEYFLQRKADRFKHLAAYLAPFSVELRLEPPALPALGRWLYRYGGHLVPDGGDVISALARYEPAWVGEYHGLNIVNDVAIFAGDYIVSKNKGARWDVWYGDGTKLSNEMDGFGMPCIFGLNHLGYRGHFSILEEMDRCCSTVRYRWKHGNVPRPPWDKPGEFERLLNHLGDANAPDPIPFSQLNMDELN